MSAEEHLRTKNAILQLVNKGAVSRCELCPGEFYSPYFLRQKSNGEDRFILNLKQLNKFITPPHFKMEDIRTALRLMSVNCYLASIDLKDAYLLMPIFKNHRKFLRFSFDGINYEFTCMPFGLCTAPYTFTKLMKPVAQKLRKKGIILVIYLDDILILSNSESQCRLDVTLTIKLLESLGFIINLQKSALNPSKRCTFLGFVLNSEAFCIELPDKKRKLIGYLAKQFLTRDRCKIRELAQLIGTLVAACPAISYGWLYTKKLERAKYLALQESDKNFKASMSLSPELKEDLQWWIHKVEASVNPIRKHTYSKVIFSDASRSGWGAFLRG